MRLLFCDSIDHNFTFTLFSEMVEFRFIYSFEQVVTFYKMTQDTIMTSPSYKIHMLKIIKYTTLSCRKHIVKWNSIDNFPIVSIIFQFKLFIRSFIPLTRLLLCTVIHYSEL